MKQIMVLKRDGKVISDQAEWLSIDKIIYSEPEKIRGNIRTILHTEDSQYIYCTTNDQIVELMSKEPGFMIVDRGRLANLNKEEIKIDLEKRKIMYRGKKFILVAKSKIESLKEYVEKYFRQG